MTASVTSNWAHGTVRSHVNPTVSHSVHTAPVDNVPTISAFFFPIGAIIGSLILIAISGFIRGCSDEVGQWYWSVDNTGQQINDHLYH